MFCRHNKLKKLVFFMPLFLFYFVPAPALAEEPMCPGGSSPDPDVIFCDDFDDGTTVSSRYFDYDDDDGDFVPVSGAGYGGSTGMEVVWQAGEVDAGNLKVTFGRNPVSSQTHSDTDFSEIYWRMYLKMEDGWTGNPYKLSRATILADSNWSQAMIGHIWGGSSSGDYLVMDPASGIGPGSKLATTKYNDFNNLTWLGSRTGTTPIFSTPSSGTWRCVEARVKLNTPGSSDGVFEFWVDGNLEASRTGLDWVSSWQKYGVNAVFFENYWNSGSPTLQKRYFDNLVISSSRIGCMDSADFVAPSPPEDLTTD